MRLPGCTSAVWMLHVAVEPITTSLALTVLSMRSTDTSPQRTLALQVHNATRPMPEAHYSLPGWNVPDTRIQQHVAAMVDDMEGDHSQALVEHPMMDAHAYPAMPLSLSDRELIGGVSSTHPRLFQTHDGLAADTYIHQSALPHAGVGLHARRAFAVGEPVACMRKPIHVRSWKDADAWVLIHGLQGADVIIRLNSRSFFLDDAIPQFGDSYDHCPWRAVNDAHHEPSNLAWQIFREKIDAGTAWRLVPVLVATRAIVEGEELFRDYTNVRYRSHLPSTSDEFDFEEADAPWVHAALDHLALECQEELDDLLLPGSFVPSSPSSLSEITVSSSHLAESMEDSDFVSDSVAHFQNAGFAFVARTESFSSADLFPAVVGNAHMPRTRPRRSRRWPARQLARKHLKDQRARDLTPYVCVCSSSARATRFSAPQGTFMHVLSWYVVMIPLLCHSVAIWMEVVTPGVLMLLRVLSLLVIMVVPAVGIFMLCDGMREVPSSTTSVCHDHGSGAGVSPAMVGSAHMPHARPRRSRRWPAANLTQARLGETDAPTDAPVCSSSARATGSIAFQDTPTHVLAWCLVMFPLICHCVAIWMEVVHPGLLLLLRLLSLLVVVMVPAVGIFTLCEGRRVASRSGSSSAPSCCPRPCARLTVPRALHARLRSVPSSAG